MNMAYDPYCKYINEDGDCLDYSMPGYWYNEGQGCCPDEEYDPNDRWDGHAYPEDEDWDPYPDPYDE